MKNSEFPDFWENSFNQTNVELKYELDWEDYQRLLF